MLLCRGFYALWGSCIHQHNKMEVRLCSLIWDKEICTPELLRVVFKCGGLKIYGSEVRTKGFLNNSPADKAL